MPFKISKNYNSDDWLNLGLLNEATGDWTTGIKIIKDRFQSRFFDPLLKIKNDEFSGFIILSIDCLLIETFMQFYLGTEHTDVLYRGRNGDAFTDFFLQSPHFKTEFNKASIGLEFFKQIRCGLLHQAETKKKSKIRICQPNILQLEDTNDPSKGLIIDREKFHENLEKEFASYIDNLTNNADNWLGMKLRAMAILKMNLICTR